MILFCHLLMLSFFNGKLKRSIVCFIVLPTFPLTTYIGILFLFAFLINSNASLYILYCGINFCFSFKFKEEKPLQTEVSAMVKSNQSIF